MGSLSLILMSLTLIALLQGVTSSDVPNEELVEILKCYKRLKESGQRTYVSYLGNTIRLYDETGREVSCDAEEQQRIRQRSDRRCIFSPIHCLFDRRFQTAKLFQMNRATRG